MRKIISFGLLAFSFSFLLACGSSKRAPKKESQSKLRSKRIPQLKKEKTKEADLKKNHPNNLDRNDELYAFIEKWKGVPHKMGGMSTRGVDCSGLVIQIYKEVYDEAFTNRRARDIFTELDVVSKNDLLEGDLVFFKIRSRNIDHVGLYLSDGNFVHASSSRGVMISNLNEAYYKKRFFKGGRKKS